MVLAPTYPFVYNDLQPLTGKELSHGEHKGYRIGVGGGAAGRLQAACRGHCRGHEAAKPGRIVADSEEPVRDANAEFRQRAYQKVIDLLQSKQEAFPPSGQWEPAMEEQGPPEDDVPDR